MPPPLPQIAARLGKTPGGAPNVEEDSPQADPDTDEDSGSEIDKAIYDELRARRDFGFEQDLGLELEKRNITKEAEVTKIVDAGLDEMPGVSSSTTFLPTPELTPREVRAGDARVSVLVQGGMPSSITALHVFSPPSQKNTTTV